ncbi:tetratricopeptide repeat protein [Altererythrobacter lutimaris]|uniref:Tetratricopeptide repeat protein n=1 Tax=Altererythrobacter lutimaris TaxID=2743979 RepID=A0A850H9H7_9SPHN|nr:tetratricopeptide repeat protein [Altererythrobacter lutimaris]NVE93885.1 tetratricopeptide repeat protein [Altererythrobacter lutimaris]
MRFAPAAVALSLVLAVSASVTSADDRQAAPRAATLIAQGDAALKAGDAQAAIDAFEAALAVDPGHTPIFLKLAEAARLDGLQGKAIRYYREALDRDPDNFAAISGEGLALVEKGALEKAKRNLTRLESLCGASCPETRDLKLSIATGTQTQFAAETSAAESTPASN